MSLIDLLAEVFIGHSHFALRLLIYFIIRIADLYLTFGRIKVIIVYRDWILVSESSAQYIEKGIRHHGNR